MTDWIQAAVKLSNDGKIDAALDVVYDNIFDQCTIGNYVAVDAALLEFTQVNDIDLQLGALTASRGWWPHLTSRGVLRENFKERWKTHEDVDILIKNL
jgi:hypothetical protein